MQFMEFVYLAASVEPMVSPSMIQCESPSAELTTGEDGFGRISLSVLRDHPYLHMGSSQPDCSAHS